MKRVAIIGSGVAGLAAAHALRGKAEIVLFEKGGYVGGHTHTVELEEENGNIVPIDTAFMIFNPVSYPQFSAFLGELGVPSNPHTSRFSFFDRSTGINFVSDDFELDAQALAQRHPPWLCSVIEEGKRFHRESPRDFLSGRADVPLAQYLENQGYSTNFRDHYICHLLSAVWSIHHPELFMEIPASSVIGFFYYHGGGGLGGKMSWRTVKGGSVSYVRRLLESVSPQVRLNSPVEAVREIGECVEVFTGPGRSEVFDYAVLATHADEALLALVQPTELQHRLLSTVHYHPTTVTLHTDESVMPGDRSQWVTWNYGKARKDGRDKGYVAYYMNTLQSLDARRDYFITLDYPFDLREGSVIRQFVYDHPGMTTELRGVQQQIYSLNHVGRIKFCGSYFHARNQGADQIGSHEAAFSSGAAAGQSVLSLIESSVQNWVL